MKWLLAVVAVLQALTVLAVWNLTQEIIMADETISQVDADLQSLKASLDSAAALILAKIAALESSLSNVTLTDAQQADLDALKASVAAISNIVPPTAPPAA